MDTIINKSYTSILLNFMLKQQKKIKKIKYHKKLMAFTVFCIRDIDSCIIQLVYYWQLLTIDVA